MVFTHSQRSLQVCFSKILTLAGVRICGPFCERIEGENTMQSKFNILPAEPKHLAEITEIYAHHVLHGLASFEEVPPSQEEMTSRYEKILSRNQPYFVVEDEQGHVVGYCYAGAFRERNAYRFTLETTLYLKPGFEGQGLGGLMLDKLIEEGTRRGFRQMIAVIGDSANLGSIKTHESRGFNMIGTLPGTGFKHGRWVDTVLMQLAINGGTETLPKITE